MYLNQDIKCEIIIIRVDYDGITKLLYLFREGQNFLAVVQGKIEQRRAKKLPSVSPTSQIQIQTKQVLE